MTEQIPIIKYQQLLRELEESDQKCHLLLGNGFNNSLGVNTSYKNIFERMKQNFKGYEALEKELKEYNYDIEILIQKLKESVPTWENVVENFLPDFIESKIKFDFMKAAYEIVKNEIKQVVTEEKTKGVYLLFKNFTNYFSLNYDPFLYLLLMKFKASDYEAHAIALQQTTLFKQVDLDSKQRNIYSEIQNARDEGKLKITISDSDSSEKSLKHATKNYFQETIKTHFKDKGWKSSNIKRVCDIIWEQESGKEKLSNINDGFLFDEYNPGNSQAQNIFFLHGAFHIYEDKKSIRKITQEQDKALYQRLEEIINSEEKEVVCVLTGTSDDKEKSIEGNGYLKNSFKKLSNLGGSLVVFGSSLDENDSHVFNVLNQSAVDKVYISTNPDNLKKTSEKAKKVFPGKEVQFFDYETVSYQITAGVE